MDLSAHILKGGAQASHGTSLRNLWGGLWHRHSVDLWTQKVDGDLVR
jgi:hypothetical protein